MIELIPEWFYYLDPNMQDRLRVRERCHFGLGFFVSVL